MDSFNSEAWTQRIIHAVERAERMSFRFNMPCHVIDQPNFQVDVRLEANVRRNDVILETVQPPAARIIK